MCAHRVAADIGKPELSHFIVYNWFNIFYLCNWTYLIYYITLFLTSTLKELAYKILQFKSVKKTQLNILSLKFQDSSFWLILFNLNNRVGEKVTCFGCHAASVAWLVQDTGISVIICLIRESVLSCTTLLFFFGGGRETDSSYLQRYRTTRASDWTNHAMYLKENFVKLELWAVFYCNLMKKIA
jgi:hypothetical protein